MAAPNEKLAESLDVLKALQQGGRRVFRSDDLGRVHRERLADLLQTERARRRQHAVVRLILGILRAPLQPPFRRGVVPLAGAVALAPWRKNGHPGPRGGQQP